MTRHSSEHALNDQQFERLLDAASTLPAPYDAECTFILLVGGRLGLRAGEICHLHESWINWERKIIEIPAYWPCEKGRHGGPCGYCRKQSWQETKHNDELTFEEALEGRWHPKTANSARAVPFDFDPEIEATIEAFFETREQFPRSRVVVNRRVNRVLGAAGLPKDTCYPHALRATAATYHAYRGVGTAPLKVLLGWRKLATAEKYIRKSGSATQQALRNAHAD